MSSARTRRLSSFALAVIIALSLFVVATPAAPRYTMISIGTPRGFYYAYARDINNRRQIVGSAVRDFSPRAVIWENGGHALLPLTPGPQESNAYAINDLGQIVGWSGFDAVIWENGGVRALARSETSGCAAVDINNQGQIVGFCDGSAFLWENGVFTRMPPPPGGQSAIPASINGLGLAVGAADYARPVLWWRDSVLELARLPGGRHAATSGVNSWGQVVGEASDALNVPRAVSWQWGRIVPLFMPPGERYSRAAAINDRGQIVGTLSGVHPVLWDNGSVIYLPGWDEENTGGALGINDRGEIVGHIGPPDTQGDPVLWVPQPQ